MRRAAELLGTNPTTVSRRIKGISERLGVMLFQMHKGGDWTITEEGRRLLDAATTFRDKLDNLKLDSAEQAARVSIKITSIEFLLANYLACDLAAGLDCYPETQIELLGSDKRFSLAYGEADLALRFGRPVEGQLIASKIAEVEFGLWSSSGQLTPDWIGLRETLDWTPEMEHGLKIFDRAPLVRVSSYSAAREAAKSLGLATIGPASIMMQERSIKPIQQIDPVIREVWSVIHESRKLDQRLQAIREWAKIAILKKQRSVRLTNVA